MSHSRSKPPGEAFERVCASAAAELQRLESVNWRADPMATVMRLRALIEISEGADIEELCELAAAAAARRGRWLPPRGTPER